MTIALHDGKGKINVKIAKQRISNIVQFWEKTPKQNKKNRLITGLIRILCTASLIHYLKHDN